MLSGQTASWWTRRRWSGSWCPRQHVCVPGRRLRGGVPRRAVRRPVRWGRGRPSLPAPVAAAVLTLQSLDDLSDAGTAQAARCDLRWQVATGMALEDGGSPSTLTYWRQRLAGSKRPHRINEAVKRVVEPPGLWVAAGGGWWMPRSWPMRSPPRARSPSWSRRSGGGRECPVRPPRSRRCALGMTPPPRTSPRSTGRIPGQGRAGVGAGQRRQRAGGGAGRRRVGRAGPGRGGAGGAGRRASRGTCRGLGWDRGALADRPQGGRGPGQLHRGSRRPAHPQVPQHRRDGDRAHVAAEPATGIITDEALTGAAGCKLRCGRGRAVPGRRSRTSHPDPSTPSTTMPAPASGMAIRPLAPGTCATPSPRPGRSR